MYLWLLLILNLISDYRFGVEHYNELLSVYNQCEHVFSPIEFLSNMKAKNVAPDKVHKHRSRRTYITDDT